MGLVLVKKSGKWFRESEGIAQKNKVLALPHISEAVEFLREGFVQRVHLHSSEVRIGKNLENEVVLDGDVPEAACAISIIEGRPLLDVLDGEVRVIRKNSVLVPKKAFELFENDVIEIGPVSLLVKLDY